MTRPLMLGLLALSACATTPAVSVRTVEKLVPVPVPCVAKASIPAEPGPTGIIPPDARQAADLLGSKVLELRGWGHKQAALLIGCSTD